MHRDVGEHRRFVIVATTAIAEVDPIECDGQTTLREPHGNAGLRGANGNLEHPEHPTHACHGRLGLIEHLGEFGDRFEEPIREEDEANHRSGGESTRRTANQTGHHHRRHGEHTEHFP